MSDPVQNESSQARPQDWIRALDQARSDFPESIQKEFIFRLLADWRNDPGRKVVSSASVSCSDGSGACIHLFGILSRDWPGLSNACLGVFHEMGWNVDYVNGFNLLLDGDTIGVVVIGIRTTAGSERARLEEALQVISSKLHQAAVGTGAKTALLAEEIRKLEIYSRVVALIEQTYDGPDLDAIVGMNGEAVKYFAARSRDFIENRSIEDIAGQIVRNHRFIKDVRDTAESIQLDVSNIDTRTEGTFTTVTVAGPARLLNLEDCLKTIALAVPGFSLKHNREFTTNGGVSLYRIEFVDSMGHPLAEAGRDGLRRAFHALVLDKRRTRAQWIEAIGGFEHFARAIIPLLVREAQSTNKAQVYQSVGQTTEPFIDFKIIVVVPHPEEPRKRLVAKTVQCLEGVPGIEIFGVKPPKSYDGTEVFIIDLRANLAVLGNVESIYRTIKDRVRQALGEFRDFDEGMRTMDTEKFKSVRRMIDGVDKSLLRELYYSIEDFFRVGAPIDEIISHIRIALDMLGLLETSPRAIQVLARETGVRGTDGATIPRASLLCAAIPEPLNLLKATLDVLENVDVTLSRLERPSWTILVCRITLNDRALPPADLEALAEKIRSLDAV
jgi:hypothetical protein